MNPENSLYQAARACLLSDSVDEKMAMSGEVAEAWSRGELALTGWTDAAEITRAGHPKQPVLVHP
ncbi:MAG: DUF455 domain-containing protein, partial [Candidatus Thiodiazotropha taylori]|nr:DUF455 domain-containing protein [Candidatus Thiodiazotropha taylori]